VFLQKDLCPAETEFCMGMALKSKIAYALMHSFKKEKKL
jgi:hypothetical protein